MDKNLLTEKQLPPELKEQIAHGLHGLVMSVKDLPEDQIRPNIDAALEQAMPSVLQQFVGTIDAIVQKFNGDLCEVMATGFEKREAWTGASAAAMCRALKPEGHKMPEVPNGSAA